VTPAWPFVRRALHLCKSMFLDVHATKSYAQEGEDMVLQRIFGAKARGFYVDVGAHHPKRFSNTYIFYKRGWRGINVEPNPASIRSFKRERPRDINLQVGVSDVTGSATYYEFDEPALNTFDRATMDRLRDTPYRLLGSTEVPLLRLDDVLRQHLPPQQEIDFLSVDVEGSDLSTLRSNDWGVFRPACVLAEALGAASVEEVLRGELASFMIQQRYVLFAKTMNTVFFLDRSQRD
jgi:FkbM family methyltransferase